MSDLRVVQYTDPHAFVHAVTPYDDYFMNFGLGFVMDSLNPHHSKARDNAPETRRMFGVFRGETLMLTLSKVDGDYAWVLSVPRHAQHPPDSESDALSLSSSLSDAVRVLVSSLSSSIPAQELDSVFGPEALVDTFLSTWISYHASASLHLKLLDPYFTSSASFASLSSLPPPSASPHHISLSLAETEEDILTASHLYIAFVSHGPTPPTLPSARSIMSFAASARWLWLCRIDGEIAGYTSMGRATPNTIAVRNVYVKPEWRRRGVAEAMVRAVARYYLGVEEVGVVGALEEGEVVREVCINVLEEGIARIYRRCGFLLGEGEKEPGTGKEGSYRTMWRGVEVS